MTIFIGESFLYNDLNIQPMLIDNDNNNNNSTKNKNNKNKNNNNNKNDNNDNSDSDNNYTDDIAEFDHWGRYIGKLF